MSKVLGIVPARGGSKGIARKNIHELCGKPLIAWTIEACLQSQTLDRTILSSEDAEIVEIARQLGLEVPFLRPLELAGDETPALPVIQHAVRSMEDQENFKPDYIVWLQPTSPLRTARHIDEAVKLLIESGADSVVSVLPVPHNCIPQSVMLMKEGRLIPFLPTDERQQQRQLKPEFYARNGAAIYAFTYDCLMDKNSIYGDHIMPYFMSREESIDIDDPFDLELCEFMLQRRVAGQKG